MQSSAVAARPLRVVEEVPDLSALARLIDAGARGGEGCMDAYFPGVRYARYSASSPFVKTELGGAVLVVVAQGRKLGRWGASELVFDPFHYLVVTAEGTFEGRVLEATPAHPYLGVSVCLPAEVVAKVLLALAGDQETASPETVPAFTGPLDGAMVDNVERFLRAVDDPVARRIVAPLALEELVFRLLRSDAAAAVRSAVGRAPDADQIQRAMSFMRAHLTEPISVEAVARSVAMSASHFAHRFRAVTRVSPMRYLKQLRMEKGRQLMIVDGARVSEAAAAVGYESASHFARDFKQGYGASPAAYLRHFRGQIAGPAGAR
jgi:AraC-like DNA-binding protein